MSDLPPALTALAENGSLLGLQAGAVHVVDHHPEWLTLADGVVAYLHDALLDLEAEVEVEHVGSTSVPGLAAKPLLDFVVGLSEGFDKPGVIERLEDAGFVYQTDLGLYGGLLFMVQATSSRAVAHIHVVATVDRQWVWYLAFRDGLRADSALRDEYEGLKRQAAVEFATNRDAYTQAKFDWVLGTVLALSETDADR